MKRTNRLTSAIALFATVASSASAAQEASPVLQYWAQPYDEAQEAELVGLVRRMQAYLDANYPPVELPVVSVEALANRHVLHWILPHGDTAEWRAFEQTASTDEGWQALLEQVKSAFSGDGHQVLFPLGGARGIDPLMPYREVRLTHARSSTLHLARRHARDVVEYLEESYPEIDAVAYSADLHDPTAIYWFVAHYSLESWEGVRERLLADERYLALKAREGELFHEGGGLESMTVLLGFDPNDVTWYEAAAGRLRESGDFAGEAAFCRRIIELEPDSALAHRFLGHALADLGEPAGALAIYRRWAELQPEDPEALRNVAWILANGERADLRDAEQALRMAQLADGPRLDRGPYALTLGVCRYRLGDLSGCLDDLMRAVMWGAGGDPYEWLFQAMAHHRLGDEDEARRWFEKSTAWIAEHGLQPAVPRYGERRRGELADILAEARSVLELPEQRAPHEVAPPIALYWRLEYDAPSASDAEKMLERMVAYERVNHPEFSPRQVLADQNSPTYHVFMEAAGLQEVEHRSSALEAEEGWRALMEDFSALFGSDLSDGQRIRFLGGVPLDPTSNPWREMWAMRCSHMNIPAARAFAARLVEHLEATYDGLDARAYAAEETDPTAIYWMLDYYAEADWMLVRRALLADEEYMRLFAEADGVFLDEETSLSFMN